VDIRGILLKPPAVRPQAGALLARKPHETPLGRTARLPRMPATPTAPDPLDAFDRQILTLVQRDCQLKAEAIASQIGLSASAVQRRLKRLRAQGVIRAEIAVLDRAAAGRSLTLVAGLEIERRQLPRAGRLPRLGRPRGRRSSRSTT